MFTCKWFDKVVDDHLAGRLGRLRSFAFWAHLKLCPPCRKYIVEYQKTIDLAHQQRAEEAAPVQLSAEQIESITRSMEQNPPQP